MAYLKLGTSIGPCRVTSEKIVENEDERGSCDPDKLLQCPFDKNHKIRSCRFPYHLIKCRKNHPELASQLKTCPFNARHLVPRHELPYHTETCEDRISLDTEVAESSNGPNWHVPVNTTVNMPMTEDWDQEVEDNPVPFMWGVNPKFDQIPSTKPSTNLGLNHRAPNKLPWSSY